MNHQARWSVTERRSAAAPRRRTHARLKGVKLTHFVADCTPPLYQPVSVPLAALSFVRGRPVSSSHIASSTRELSAGGERSNDGVESRPRGRHPSPTTRPVDTARPWVNPAGLDPATDWTNDETDAQTTLSHCVLIA